MGRSGTEGLELTRSPGAQLKAFGRHLGAEETTARVNSLIPRSPSTGTASLSGVWLP